MQIKGHHFSDVVKAFEMPHRDGTLLAKKILHINGFQLKLKHHNAYPHIDMHFQVFMV